MQRTKYNKFGENHPRARLTNREVDNIRTLFEHGMTQSVLAEKFGVSLHTVKSICEYRRRTAYLGARRTSKNPTRGR